MKLVNNVVTDFCDLHGIDSIRGGPFLTTPNNLHIVKKPFAQDGVHLNRNGIEIMNKVIKDYISNLYK